MQQCLVRNTESSGFWYWIGLLWVNNFLKVSHISKLNHLKEWIRVTLLVNNRLCDLNNGYAL